MQNSLVSAVLQTIVYSDIFDYPLTSKEIHTYLHQCKIPYSTLHKNLKSVPGIEKTGQYWHRRGKSNLVSIRRSRNKITRAKMKDALNIAHILSYIPSILLIGVSGSVACGNARKRDDIDFFIVTRNNTLWFSRFIVTILIFVLGRKRMPGVSESPNKICTNMWMSVDSLQVSKKNLFTAREIVQLQVVFDRKNTFSRFLSQNRWVHKYLPNFSLPDDRKLETGSFLSTILFVPDLILYGLQRLYMKRKITTETVSRNFAAFHPKDGSRRILLTYHKKVRGVLGEIEIEKLYLEKGRKISTFPDFTRITPGS